MEKRGKKSRTTEEKKEKKGEKKKRYPSLTEKRGKNLQYLKEREREFSSKNPKSSGKRRRR